MKRALTSLASLICLALALGTLGCAPTVTDSKKDSLAVVATTTFVADLAASILGENGTVVGLMGPGVDPHLYKATAGDVNRLQTADVIFYNGLHLEGRMTEVLVRLGRQGTPVYAITEDLPEENLLEPAEFAGHYDPHVWFDPELWIHCVNTVVNALSEVDPSNAESYARRGRQTKTLLNELKQWGISYSAQIPVKSRILVTSHDAYNYFGKAFDFQVVGVQGISTVSEAGLADIIKVSQFIKEKEIKAIFVESSVSPSTIERISDDSGAVIGGELFSDALGEPGRKETGPDGKIYDVGTYEGMFRHNMTTIVEALK
jgi:manganese/zinc/iron transport system substrate-binding protein